jgi:hypothetical protein
MVIIKFSTNFSDESAAQVEAENKQGIVMLYAMSNYIISLLRNFEFRYHNVSKFIKASFGHSMS